MAIDHDPTFGPVICVGPGGTEAQANQDRRVALPPLNRFLGEELIGRSQSRRSLAEIYGIPEAGPLRPAGYPDAGVGDGL